MGDWLYGALGVPGKMENLRITHSNANTAHDVNPYHHDLGKTPVEMQRMLTTLYSTRSTLVKMSGSAVLDSPISGPARTCQNGPCSV